MRRISLLMVLVFISACSLPSLVRSPLEFLGFLRFFNRSSDYTLGGAVSGIVAGRSVSIKNGSDEITVSSDGNFTFPTKLKTGTNFDVSITTSGGEGMECTLSNGKGTMQASNISNVDIRCGWGSGFYEVGVSVTGITSSISVQNNSTDTLTFSSVGLFKFSNRIKTGSSYAVTITSQTAGSVCAFDNPTLSIGTMATTNVTIFIRCVTGYLSGGTIQTVAAATLVSPTASSQNFYLRTMVGSYPASVPPYTPGSFGNFPLGVGTAVANLARFDNPKGMARANNFVYVADYTNNLIRRIDQSNGDTTTFAGGNAGGGVTCPGVTTTNCKDGIGLDAQFNGPFKLTTDGTNLYVLEFLGNRIRRINLSTAAVTTLAGNGNATFADNANGILASFNVPHDITLYNGTLYVADRQNHCIRAVNPVTSAVSTFVGTCTIPGYTDLSGTSAQLNNPIGVVGLGGFLYFTDIGNERIRRISLSGANSVTTIAGNGTSASVDGFGTNAQFGGPFSIATDGTDLFISDYNTYKIRHLRISDNRVTTLVGGGGASGYEDNAVSNSRMGQPIYLLSDGSNLYVSDEVNHSIRRLENAEILRYTFDGNGNDSIGTNNGSLPGAPNLVSDENGTANGAYEFNGTSQHFIANSNVQINGSALGIASNKKFTVSAWIYPRGGTADQVIFANGTPNTDGFALILQGTTRYLYVNVNNIPSGISLRRIPLNQWTHVTLTNNADTWRIYVNGMDEGIAFVATPITPTTNFTVAFGGGVFSRFKGKISDVRILQGALDIEAIQKLAVQVPSGLLAYYPLNGSLNDFSGNLNHLTQFGAPVSTTDRNGLNGHAYSFVAPNDYLEKASPNMLPTGNASRTTCAWVRATTTPSNVVSFGVTGGGQMNGLALGNSAILHYGYTGPFDHVTNHFYLQNRWVHICGTYDGTDSRIYYNGALQSTMPYVWTTGISALLRIGRNIPAVEFFSGQIDDVRIYNRVLTASEVQALSGAHPIQINGLQMHLQASSLTNSPVVNWLDNSPNNTTATSTGGNSVGQPTAINQPTWSAAAVNGTPGVIFDGINDILVNNSGSYFGLGTDSFTYFLVSSRNTTTGAQAVMSTGPILGGKIFMFDTTFVSPCSTTNQFGVSRGILTCAARSNHNFSITGIQSILSISYDSVTSITSPFYWDTTGPEGATITAGLSFVAPAGGTGIAIGARFTPINFYDGVISEIIYYDRVLTTTEADSVRCYLSRKYNIPVGNTCP